MSEALTKALAAAMEAKRSEMQAKSLQQCWPALAALAVDFIAKNAAPKSSQER